MKALQKIDPADLVCLQKTQAIRIDLDYASEDNLLFGERIYSKKARLWLHKDLAKIVEATAENLLKQGFRMVLHDGLRTTDAQARMLETRAVKSNLHWLAEPRLLSPPGAGAHPRGMAIDCSIETLDGNLLDMGTPFDYLAEEPTPEGNPAHRAHPHHSQQIMENRALLTNAMLDTAQSVGIELLPLPQEWWDYRLPHYEEYEPLSDADLPAKMRMCD